MTPGPARGLLTASFAVDGRPLAEPGVAVSPLTLGPTIYAHTDRRGRITVSVPDGCCTIKLVGTRMRGVEVPERSPGPAG